MKTINISAVEKMITAINDFIPEIADRPDFYALCGFLRARLNQLVIAAEELSEQMKKGWLNFDDIDFARIFPEMDQPKETAQSKVDPRAELMMQTYKVLSSKIENWGASPMPAEEAFRFIRVLCTVLLTLAQMDGQETSR